MENVTSTFEIGPTQVDGRWYVSERHEVAGQVYPYEYLADGSLNPQMVLEERAAVIAATLAAREAARLAVAGTSVPLTRYEFLSRFTPQERVAIREAAKTDPIIDDFMEMMKLSGNVSLVLARPGLHYISGRYPPILTEARATEIGAE